MGMGSVLSAAALLDASNGSTAAASGGFSLLPGEGAAILGIFSTPGIAFASGVTIGGKKYTAAAADSAHILAKLGTAGACLYKTNQSIVLGLFTANTNPTTAANQVANVANNLIENGF